MYGSQCVSWPAGFLGFKMDKGAKHLTMTHPCIVTAASASAHNRKRRACRLAQNSMFAGCVCCWTASVVSLPAEHEATHQQLPQHCAVCHSQAAKQIPYCCCTYLFEALSTWDLDYLRLQLSRVHLPQKVILSMQHTIPSCIMMTT